ncbi:hypothetical protein LJC72_04740 [Bacteroides sp. OttesenSCG-928-D19]|nr:hypothetical protein [Bacteroides sp. OttesenSCG-928-D19]
MSGLKYIWIVLCCSLFLTNAYGVVEKDPCPEWLMCVDEYSPSGEEKITASASLPLSHVMIIADDDYHSVKVKIHPCRLFNYGYNKRICYSGICFCEPVDVNRHSLDYYIYTLEKIVI